MFLMSEDLNIEKVETYLEEKIEQVFAGEDITPESHYRIVMYGLEVLEQEFGLEKPIHLCFDDKHLMPIVTILDCPELPQGK